MAGHAFIIGDVLLTSAHVVYNTITGIECAQSGKMINIVSYISGSEALAVHDKFELNGGFLSNYYDVASVKLSRRLVSKYVLPNIEDLRMDLTKKSEWDLGVVKIQDTEGYLRSPVRIVEFHSLTPDLDGISVVRKDDGDYITEPQGIDPDLYISNDPQLVEIKVRDSGSPLCARMQSGQYVVVGITVAGARGETPSGKKVYSKFFTPLSKVSPWLTQHGLKFPSRINLQAPNCKDDLH